MKLKTLAICMAAATTLATGAAFAGEGYGGSGSTSATVIAGQQQQQSSYTASGANNASNSGTNQQNINFNSPGQVDYSGSYTLKNVPNVSGPALTTSNDTCMGSSSGGVSAPGFGLSLGTTWTDTNCKMLKNSRELWNMGMKAASLALLCKDADNKEALEITGFVCPQTKRDNKQAAATSQVTIVPVADTAITTSDIK